MLMHTTDLVVPSGVLPHPAPAPTCTGHNTIPLNNVGWKEVEMKVNDLDIHFHLLPPNIVQRYGVMTCASGSRSRMWQNPTGDNQVSSVHEHGSGAKVVSSMTALAHRFPPPLLSGC